MSLSPQTIRIRHRLAEWTKSGRKHWDLYRWLINPIILHDATKNIVKNGGVAGIDGRTCEGIEGHEWEFAVELSTALRSGTYRPRAVRRVYIPKRDGKERPLGIPTIEDRVIQRALVLLLEPIYEQIFLGSSYGYRRGKSAVECVSVAANEVYRHRFVLEADIERFFDNVSHKKLLGMLKQEIVDPRILNLVQQFLVSGFVERDKPWQSTWVGTPQGGPLSPMLANIYLHYALDVRFKEANPKRSCLLRFCDDFIVISQSPGEVKTMKSCIELWLKAVGLTLKGTKTRLIDLRNKNRGRESHFDFLGYRFHLRAYRDNPKRFWIARQPSRKARMAFRENLKARLVPELDVKTAREEARMVWMGWCNYFRYGNSNRVFYRELHSLKGIVRWYLRRKYRQQRRPVSWKRLSARRKLILKGLKPPTVIPNYLSQQQPCLL